MRKLNYLNNFYGFISTGNVFVVILIILSAWGVNYSHTYEPNYIEKNITYQVKEVHIGTSDNTQFIKVFYYCNDQIQILTSSSMNPINIYRTQEPSKLIWVDECTNYNSGFDFPANHFDLYISDNMSFTGENSEWKTVWSNGKTSGTIQHKSTIS
jgi:hypothetical protein